MAAASVAGWAQSFGGDVVAASAVVADSAAVVRPARRVVELAAGSASVLDTYLTPVRYSGWDIALRYEHSQATGFAPQRWVRRLTVGADYANVHNPNRTGNRLHVLDLSGEWALMRRWRPRPCWQFTLGPMIDADGGAVYNPAGSNNVVSVRARVGVGAAATASLATRMARRPLTLTAAVSLPVLGVWFSPDGDESYYEMYVGNRRHLAHLAWWGNRFDAGVGVTADWRLGGTVLRLAYRARFETSACRGLDTRLMRHTVGIGLGGDFVSLSPSHRLDTGIAVITAQY